MASANRRGAAPRGEALPLSADGKALAISVAVYAGLFFLHPYIAGVPIA
jgi:hypothetical protein